ncbi:NAD-dependent epimerase/dehydratase family protein [Paenibacillus thiaminolyticus]|uniref:NAD-dependent epimerase/dehydratase family protein n=1 Tax=Paenibacillus thiaminolyticus TaxID=49283 RepID=UPI003D2BAB7F
MPGHYVHVTRRLLELASDAGVSRVVLTSTTALYGGAAIPEDRAGWVDEERVPSPRTIYHRTKLAAEEEVRKAAAYGRLSATVLRMSRCFPSFW